MTKLGERLKELRTEKGLSQQQIADLFNINQTNVGYWERGTFEPDLTTLTELAKFFGVTTDFLLGLKDY